MAEPKRAKLFRNGGSQAVRLPADFRFEGDEVFISRDEATGNVIISASKPDNWFEQYLAEVADLVISEEDLKEWDSYMAERPLNVSFPSRGIFDDDLEEGSSKDETE